MTKSKGQFNDQQRAQIFAEGKGTCAFCGHNLWILSFGISPFWEQDWADHIKPSSRRGTSTHDNGICSCCSCNTKKSSNSRDKAYLLTKLGRPTYFGFVWRRHRIDETIATQLQMLSRLQPVDWYFNRALTNSFWHMANEFEGEKKKRGKKYWLGAAWRFLKKWRKQMDRLERAGEKLPSFENRGLVPKPKRADVRLVLSLRDAQTEKAAFKILDSLNRFYQATCNAWYRFAISTTLNGKRAVLARATRNRFVTMSATDAMRQYVSAYARHPSLLPSKMDEESGWW